MTSEKHILEKLEIVLNKHNQRPCDFWDNINRAEWDNMLNKLAPMSVAEVETFLVADGYV